MQLACKPASVRFRFLRKNMEPFPIIYLVLPSLAGSYDPPPGTGRAILKAGIHDLSTHGLYGFPRHHGNR